jgi:ATP-binding cassette subfamily F protein 3
VCTSLIEVRHGTARFHPDVDEAVLTPTLGPAPAAAPAPRSQLAQSSRGTPPNARAASRRDERRSEAQLRDARHKATKDLKKAVRESERAWEKAEKVVSDIEQQLADPEIYGDHSRIAELAARHGQARKEALAAMEAWEKASDQLAAAEAAAP